MSWSRTPCKAAEKLTIIVGVVLLMALVLAAEALSASQDDAISVESEGATFQGDLQDPWITVDGGMNAVAGYCRGR